MYPELFRIGDFIIPTYGFILAIAYLTAISTAVYLGVKENLEKDKIIDLGLVALIASVLGAKITLILVNIDYYIKYPGELLSTLRSAGVFYGGLIAAIIVGLWYIRKHSLPLWTTMDITAPAIALGQAIGRLGCLAAGCCYGKHCELPWAITFTNPVANQIVGVPLNVPLHPTQIYSSLGAFVIFLVLLFIYKKRSYGGQVIFWYIILYGMFRSFVEIYRGDPRGFMFFNTISVSQIISLVLVITAVVCMNIFRRRNRLGKDA